MIVDAHVHLFAPAQAERRDEICARDATFAEMYANPRATMATLADIVRVMDRDGIGRAVAVGFAFDDPMDTQTQALEILAAPKESGGRVVPIVPINPVPRGWQEYAEVALKHGARGFGELRPHNQGWDPLGAGGHELCELAGAAGAVLHWHVSEPVGHRYPGKDGGITPAELCRLAEAHPRTKMVAAHLGGGLSFYLQMPEVRLMLANVWFDTAAASLLYDGESVARLVSLAGAERVMFGSDYPLLSPGRQVQRISAALRPGDARAVLGATAETLFSDTQPA